MPKPKHRRVAAREQRWLPWALTAVAVPLVLAVSAGTASGLVMLMFAVLLLAFFAGSISGTLFLTRSAVVQPQRAQLLARPARELVSGSPAWREENPAVVPDSVVVPSPRVPARSERMDFASSQDADRILQVAVLISVNERPLDPADGAPPITPQLGGTVIDPVRTAVASAASDVAIHLVEPGPYPGSVLATADGETPHGGYDIKGNSRSMLYHTKESPYFSRTKASVWFRSVADAECAGFIAWNRRAPVR